MDEVTGSGEETAVTKNGRPVWLAPCRRKPDSFLGRDRDKIGILGDTIKPVNTEWEAETNPGRVLNP